MDDETIAGFAREAFEGAITVGAPGVTATARNAILMNGMVRLRFLLQNHRDMVADFAVHESRREDGR